MLLRTAARRPLRLLRSGCITIAAALSREATASRKLGGASLRNIGGHTKATFAVAVTDVAFSPPSHGRLCQRRTGR
ncbi:MAG: hypothetical protein OXG64_07215 [Chloroflexi bacterium]|nr:hypothetical protein [Chloroflexota bacterium]